MKKISIKKRDNYQRYKDMNSKTSVFTPLKTVIQRSKIEKTKISECEDSRKIHRCDICASGFERRNNLKAHYMTHTGEKTT